MNHFTPVYLQGCGLEVELLGERVQMHAVLRSLSKQKFSHFEFSVAVYKNGEELTMSYARPAHKVFHEKNTFIFVI